MSFLAEENYIRPLISRKFYNLLVMLHQLSSTYTSPQFGNKKKATSTNTSDYFSNEHQERLSSTFSVERNDEVLSNASLSVKQDSCVASKFLLSNSIATTKVQQAFSVSPGFHFISLKIIIFPLRFLKTKGEQVFRLSNL